MKYSILTFGCRVNQAESCRFEGDLQARGGVPSSPEAADVVVVNTCSVTAAADQSGRRAIRRVARLNPSARIIATGCYATRRPDDLVRLPGVAALLPNDRKPALVSAIAAAGGDERGLAGAGLVRAGFKPAPTSPFDGIAVTLPPGARGRTAYPLLVQSGCDERCSYCIIPSTRGASRSRPIEDVLREARRQAAAGFKELWLTGVHLGSYGRDLSPARSLLDLLQALDAEPGDTDYRLSSLEPMDCTAGVVDLVARSGRFLPHLHLPLQHASDRMLQAMGRPYSCEGYRRLVDHVRDRLPDAAIGSDIIVGFPGESDRDHDEQVAYLADSPLTHLHVFPYSDRPGTGAASLVPKVGAALVRRRTERLRAIGRTLSLRFAEQHLGLVRPALTLEDGSLALTDNYLKVRIPPGRARNERVKVRVLHAAPLQGEVVA